MFEKWCTEALYEVLIGLLVLAASSMATRSPATETIRAAIFRVAGMVITGVFRGRKLYVITSPAIILPQASRLIGSIADSASSLMGDSGRNRGDPIVTKYTSRKL